MKYPTLPTAILLTFLLLATGCMNTSAPQTTGPGSGASSPVVIDALVTLTGPYSSQGAIAKAALLTAEEDINRYSASIGSERRVSVVFHDTASDPATALTRAKEVQKSGRRIFLGHMTSAEIASIKTFVDENGMLVLDAGSTSPSLAIPGDSIFRLISDDSAQGEAMAMWLGEQQIRAIVPLWRGDIWGDNLLNATRGAFLEHGGLAIDGIRFGPETTDFSFHVASLDLLAGDAIEAYGADHVGIYLIGFEESAPIIEKAAGRENLTRIRWFGCDGNADIPSLAGVSPAATAAARVNFTCVVWGIAHGDPSSEPQTRIRERLGYPPSSGSITLYDALWVVHDLLNDVPINADQTRLTLALERHLNTYQGETGSLVTNEAGDRALASYDVFRVMEQDGIPQWKRIGHVIIWEDRSEHIGTETCPYFRQE